MLAALKARDDAALEAAVLRVIGQPMQSTAVLVLLRLHLDSELSAARTLHRRVGMLDPLATADDRETVVLH